MQVQISSLEQQVQRKDVGPLVEAISTKIAPPPVSLSLSSSSSSSLPTSIPMSLALPPISKQFRDRHISWAKTCGAVVDLSALALAASPERTVLLSTPPRPRRQRENAIIRDLSPAPSSSSECPALSDAGDSDSASSIGVRTPPRPPQHRFLTPVDLPIVSDENKKYKVTTYTRSVNEQVRVVNGNLVHRKYAVMSLDESIARMARSSPSSDSNKRKRSSTSHRTTGSPYTRTYISPVPLIPRLRHPMPYVKPQPPFSSPPKTPLRRHSLPTTLTGIIPEPHQPTTYAPRNHRRECSNSLGLDLGEMAALTKSYQARTIYDRPHPYYMKKAADAGLLPPIELRPRSSASVHVQSSDMDVDEKKEGIELWRRRVNGKVIQPLNLVR